MAWVEMKEVDPPEQAAGNPGHMPLVAMRLQAGRAEGAGAAAWEFCGDEDQVLATPGEHILGLKCQRIQSNYGFKYQNDWFPESSNGAMEAYDWAQLRDDLQLRYPEQPHFRRILADPRHTEKKETGRYNHYVSPKVAYNWNTHTKEVIPHLYVPVNCMYDFRVLILAADETPYLWSDPGADTEEAMPGLALEVKRRGEVLIYHHERKDSAWRLPVANVVQLAQLHCVIDQYRQPERVELDPDWAYMGWRLIHRPERAKLYLKRRVSAEKAKATKLRKEEAERKRKQKLNRKRNTARVEPYEMVRLANVFIGAMHSRISFVNCGYGNSSRNTSDDQLDIMWKMAERFCTMFGELHLRLPEFRQFLREWRYRRDATLNCRLYQQRMSRDILYWLDLQMEKLKTTKAGDLPRLGTHLAMPSAPKHVPVPDPE